MTVLLPAIIAVSLGFCSFCAHGRLQAYRAERAAIDRQHAAEDALNAELQRTGSMCRSLADCCRLAHLAQINEQGET